MCGISGIYRQAGVKISELQQMNLIIKHRGPDDEGYLLSSNNQNKKVLAGDDTDGKVMNSGLIYAPDTSINNFQATQKYSLGLAHRRLSILDLSPKGHMPMCDEQQRFWVTYNGEVYNFIEIRNELENNGFHFKTETDTEVIIAAYKFWGKKCLDKFVGMFSFVIYDIEKHELFLARDRFGIKPLYYWISSENSFYFGSEIKQFTVCNNWRAVLNHQKAYDFLYYSLTDHTDETMFKGVYQVKPGYACLINLNEYNFSSAIKIPSFKWYNPNEVKFEGSFEDAKNQFKKLLINSVDLHLRSDVTVGSALSGGLDSSSIVCIVNDLLKESKATAVQNTFSSVHENEMYSEKNWIDQVINHTIVNPHFVYPGYTEFIKSLPKLIWFMDEPYQSQSAFLGNQVFASAKQQNVTVLLNGQGADEYLSGYGDFKNLRFVNYIKSFRFKKIQNELKLTFTEVISFSLKSFSRHLYDSINGRLRFYLASKSANYKILSKLVDSNVLEIHPIHPKDTYEYNKSLHKEISNYQLFSNPLPRYLRWEDRNSMCHSIEARVPFLDHRLVEFCHSLPLEYLDGQGSPKMLLSESMSGILPENIKNRKDKKGFITPEEQWVRFDNSSDFRKLLEDSIQSSKGIITNSALDYFDYIVQGKLPFDYTYWRLILFGIWMKEFNIELK